jgi:hypothetical protein
MERESSHSPLSSYGRSLEITGRHDYFTASTSSHLSQAFSQPTCSSWNDHSGPLSPVNPVDHVVNLVMSLVEPVDKVVEPIPSSVNPTLPLESETQAVDSFPPVDPILPLENETQVVDLISPSVDPTLPLESKSDTAHIFLVDTD